MAAVRDKSSRYHTDGLVRSSAMANQGFLGWLMLTLIRKQMPLKERTRREILRVLRAFSRDVYSPLLSQRPLRRELNFPSQRPLGRELTFPLQERPNWRELMFGSLNGNKD